MATDDGYRDLQRALAVLARLASTTTTSKSNPYDVIGRSPDWSWEGLRHQACFVAHDIQDYLRAVEAGVVAPRPPPGWADTSTEWWPLLRTDRFSRPEQAKRLAGLDQLRHRDTILRAGWLWLTGTVDIDGEDQVVCMPLLQTRIKLEAGRFSGDRTWSVVDAGDVYANPLMQPESEVDWVLSNPQFGRGWGQREFVWSTKAKSWAARAAQACGLTIESWGQPSTDPRSLRRKEGLVAIPGFGVYIDPANRVMPRSKQLMEWTTSRGISETAFAHLYGQRGQADNEPVDDSKPIRATRPMLPEQREVVRLARSEPIVTVTGPPGTGKTHVMCEIALDAVARNQSVLIGANSEFAVEVLAKQIDVAGGPIPVQFGGSIRGADLSDRLIELTSSTTPRLRQRAEEEMDEAATAYQTLVARFDDLLALERRINLMLADPTYRLKHEGRLAQLPGGADQLEALAADLARIRRSSPLTRWWRARSLERRTALSIDELGPEVEALSAYRQASRLLAGDGLTLTALADRMTDAGTDVFAANARWLGHLTVERLADNALGKRTIQQISTASRAGRSRRREMLSQVNGAALADAAPLWLGTVDDIDDVLPANAAMFDLLILDEASQMDQIAAAGALLRSSRAVVCGDPRQLRHVSFLSDAAIDSANSNLAAEPGVEAADVRIDVRRDSVFDFGLGVGQALRLDTHFRSEPHLIDFSARRFLRSPLDAGHPKSAHRSDRPHRSSPCRRSASGQGESGRDRRRVASDQDSQWG